MPRPKPIRPNRRAPGPLLFSLVAAAFLLLAWSPFHHWDEFFYLHAVRTLSPAELLDLDGGLAASGLFNQGFFGVKIGFLAVLDGIVLVLGDGRAGLYAIQAVFALVVVAFVGASYLALREVFGAEEAASIAVVLLFMPLPMYFAYKVFSEPVSLLCVALGSWAFLRSFRVGTRPAGDDSATGRPRAGQAAWLATAALGLSVGIAFRLHTAPCARTQLGVAAHSYRFIRPGYHTEEWGTWHGFSLNPGLRRLREYQLIGSFCAHHLHGTRKGWEVERELSEVYLKRGLLAAILADADGEGYVRHIGWGRRVGDPTS